MTNVFDVARHAGVSHATVSRVITGQGYVSKEMRERVMEAVRELGYRPNSLGKALRAGYANTVAFLVGDIAQGWYASLAKEIQTAIEAKGLDLLLFDLGHNESRLKQLLLHSVSLRLRGVVMSTADRFDFAALRPIFEDLEARGIPLFSLGRRLDQHGIKSISHDDRSGARDAVRHLYSHGHRNIAYLGGTRHSTAAQERYEGYLEGLREVGLSINTEFIWDTPVYRFEGGYSAATAAFDRHIAVGAVLASSDELALGAMAAARDHGRRVPDDLAVIGFGNLEWGRYTRPSLTTLSGNAGTIATQFSEQLLGDAPLLTVIKRELILRESA